MIDEVTSGSTRTLWCEDIEQEDPETGTYADLAAPDAIICRVYEADGSTTEIAGNQRGTDNAYYARHIFTEVGTAKYQFQITEGTVVEFTEPKTVSVVASIADVP